MAESNQEKAFNEALCARVFQFRKETGMTAEQMAIALGVPPDRYRKYESRSPLPAYLMHRFCLITHVDLENLIAGKARGRAAAPKFQSKVSKVG